MASIGTVWRSRIVALLWAAIMSGPVLISEVVIGPSRVAWWIPTSAVAAVFVLAAVYKLHHESRFRRASRAIGLMFEDAMELFKGMVSANPGQVRLQVMTLKGGCLRSLVACSRMRVDDDVGLTFAPGKGWAGRAWAENRQVIADISDPTTHGLTPTEAQRVPTIYKSVVATVIRDVTTLEPIGVLNAFLCESAVDGATSQGCKNLANFLGELLTSVSQISELEE